MNRAILSGKSLPIFGDCTADLLALEIGTMVLRKVGNTLLVLDLDLDIFDGVEGRMT